MSDRVTFEVVAADMATELFLIDGNFALVGRGIGRQEFSVAPGIYKIKARSGRTATERMLIVRPGMGTVQLAAVALPSAMPLAGSAKTHEFHMSAAYAAAATPTLTVGAGSAIVIVARQWTAPQPPPGAAAILPNPARGLALRDMQGTVIADVEGLTSVQTTFDPCVAVHVALDPGAYRLTLTFADGRRVEQAVIARAGWQTHSYLLLDDGPPEEARLDLVNGAITMRRPSDGFRPEDPTLRLEEIARGALQDDRKILSPDFRAQVTSPSAPPMLALLGAHLLIREAKDAKASREVGEDAAEVDNRAEVRRIVENLRAAIGAHPDVEAIAIGAGNGDPGYAFDEPPLFRASWRLLLKASVERPDLLPAGSFGARIAERVWGEGPWLLWRDPDATETVNHSELWQATAREILSSIRAEPRAPAVTEAVVPVTAGVVVAGPSPFATFSAAAVAKLGSLFTRRARPPFPDFRQAVAHAVKEKAVVDLAGLRDTLSEDQRRALVKRLGVPMSSIDTWLSRFEK